MRSYSIDSSSSSSDSLEEQIKFKAIYAKQLKKKQALEEKRKDKEREKIISMIKPKIEEQPHVEDSIDCLNLQLSRLPQDSMEDDPLNTPTQLKWYIYPRCPQLNMKDRVDRKIYELPIMKKKQDIMDAIVQNQFVLVTGETGCGKSTQVPRLIYEYLRNTGQKAKIMCVQPRRIAVINLHQILDKQMVESNQIGYQIAMKSKIQPSNKIIFVTNGIFLQRIVHSTEFFNQFPFIILDQVHQRDIDTDFILLTIKRVIRQYPKVRVVLMSATIDNELFKYYFASDHVDKILTEQNFYKKLMRVKKEHQQQKMEDQNDVEDSDSRQNQKIYAANSFEFLKSKNPCPAINVTEPGKFTRTYFYLDTLSDFLPKGTISNRWGSIIFSQKYPNTHRELYESVGLIIDQIYRRNQGQQRKSSVLIFMPGLAQIENLSQFIRDNINVQKKKYMDIINVHSSILNDQITRKLLRPDVNKHNIIISTNISESSITVMGVQYVIDFCLSKEVRFDLKSKMENLQLVWTSKASCNQRAGRTGRVCNGTVIRLLEKKFYEKLADYSTPEIQRSSLDKLILRIKMLHEGENNNIFAEPGQVLGSAIQPPHLKNIDTAIQSLMFCGGLEKVGDQLKLTNLGRLYVDIPIDITYCKLLVISQLFGTYEDILILVSILSQSKNAIRRGSIDRSYMIYYEMIKNDQNCDFISLLTLYERTKRQKLKIRDTIRLEVFSEVQELRRDIDKRIYSKKDLFPSLQNQYIRNWSLSSSVKAEENDLINSPTEAQKEEYKLRFKMTLACGFIEHMLKVREPSFDEKQEKRLKLMKRVGIRHNNTVCILGSNVLKKPETSQAERRLVESWKKHMERTACIKSSEFTVTHGLSYLHFNLENDLHKFLFYQYIESNKKSFFDEKQYNASNTHSKTFLPMAEILKSFGEIDHMHSGRPVTFCKEQTVTIDNYSLNRVVNVNQGDTPKFLLTNNIAKQSSRMVARYTSLLPLKLNYVQIITHLLFYPFVSVTPNKKKSRYECIQLKKKHKIPIRHNLSNDEIEKANSIRKMLRNYLSLCPASNKNGSRERDQYGNFWDEVLKFLVMERPEVIEEERWQDVYLKDQFEKRPELKEGLEQMLAFNVNHQQQKIVDQRQYEHQRAFMSEIKPTKLFSHFFSNIEIGGTTLEQRSLDYNLWKQEKLREVRAIERKAQDRDSYLACGEDSCGLRIAKLIKVGPINGEIYRELFEVETDNIQELQFNDLDCHFCTLLMSNYINSEYKTYGCKNGHYFAIKLEGEKKLKILPFSELMIIYPDGSAQKAEFEKLDVKDWKRKHDEKSQGKYKIKLSTYCFVCDQILDSFKNLQSHIKDIKHIGNVNDFIKTIPEQMRQKKRREEKEQQPVV